MRGQWLVGMAGIVLGLVACEGKHREFVSGPLPGDGGGIAASRETSFPDDSSGMGSKNPGEGGPDASLTMLDGEGSGLCDSDGNCRCNGDEQSCAPLPLCEGADAGSAECAETCPGCLIDGACIGADTIDPGNACRVCDRTRNPEGWSNNDGVICDDGAFCTVDDVCGGGVCGGSPRECEDGVACNGVATCDEAGDRCTPDESQCGANALCNTESDTCATTCDGCVIAGICVPNGAEQAGNPCMMCDTARSTSSYTPAQGKACGAGPASCSGQDTCDAAGVCVPNHLAEGASCGNGAASACDLADACDGRGTCLPRLVANSTACNDGQFCTLGDECQGGVCVPTGSRNCGAGSTCEEARDRCECTGCLIGGNCFAAGALNGTNSCQVCDPARNRAAFSANVNARCGSGPTECSGQDTCNNQGQCSPNHSPATTPCGSGGQVCDGAGGCFTQAPAALVTDAAPLAFGRTLVGDVANVQRTWIVRNIGALATPPLQASTSPEFPMSGTCLGQSLPGGASCALSISFAPQSAGTRTATLSLRANGAALVSEEISGEARLASGEPCPMNTSLCDSNTCTEWFVDVDGDGFGSQSVDFPSRRICGDGSAANRPAPFVTPGACRGNDLEFPYVLRSVDPQGRLDCCDLNYACNGTVGFSPNADFSMNFFPGQTVGTAGVGTGPLGAACLPARDRNCDGNETVVSASNTATGSPVSLAGLFNAGTCAEATTAAACTARNGKVSGAEACGNITVQACAFQGNACVQVNVGQITVLCL